MCSLGDRRIFLVYQGRWLSTIWQCAQAHAPFSKKYAGKLKTGKT